MTAAGATSPAGASSSLAATGVPWRQLLAIAVLSALVRVGIVSFACATATPLGEYVHKGDGESYLLVASAMCGERSLGDLDAYHRRVFPGFPALIALGHAVGLPLPWAGLLVTIGSASAAAAMFAMACGDRRFGWAMSMLIPHYLINSSLVMSEAPMLAFAVAGWLAWRRGKPGCAGALLGAACLVRPVAAAALLGIIVACVASRQHRKTGIIGVTALLVAAAGALGFAGWSGDLFYGMRVYRDSPRAYGGNMFGWPMQSLVLTSYQRPELWRYTIWVWIHVAVTLIGVGLLIRTLRRQFDVVAVAALVWLSANTMFVLCIGSYWGYLHFPRFSIPAQPGLFVAYGAILPRRTLVWLTLLCLLAIYAAIGARGSP